MSASLNMHVSQKDEGERWDSALLLYTVSKTPKSELSWTSL